MTLSITGLAELRARLERLRPDEAAAAALAEQAERIAQSVRDGLAQPEGAGDHDKPWRRTGALHDSIRSTAAGLQAVIGSDDPAAAPQELGTARIPPRPFLAPVAAGMAQDVARTIAGKLADALRGENPSNTDASPPLTSKPEGTQDG